MTDEQKQQDATRFIIVPNGAESMGDCAFASSEGEAKQIAHQEAFDREGVTVMVFLKIGTAKLEPSVTWKGIKP